MTHNKNLIEIAKYGTNVAIIDFMKQAEDAGYTFCQDALDISLIESCNRGLKTLVQFAVNLGANVNYSRKNGDTPLIVSAWKGFTDICRLLLKKGADVNSSNNDGDTPLMAAVQPSGSIELIHLLMEQDNVDVDHQNKNGGTALMKAIEVLNLDVVILLLNSGASLDGRSKPTGTKSACVEIVNSKGESAQDIADRLNIGNVIKFLRNANNEDPLITAALNRDLVSVKFLVDTMYLSQKCYGVLVQLLKSIKTENRSVSRGEIEIFQTLLKCGYDVNWKSDSGETSLVLAVEIGSAELVEMLCSFGARLSHNEVTLAARQGRNDIISLLLYYGAPVNKFTTYQAPMFCGSALESALASEHIDTALKLAQYGAFIDIAASMTAAVAQGSKKTFTFIATNYPMVCTRIAEDTNRGLLHTAVKLGDVDIVNILLNLNADVNGVYYHKTPLMAAMHVAVIDLLVARGADVNKRTNTTVLLNVLSSDYTTMFRKILEFSQQTDHFNYCIEEIVHALLKHGASVHITTDQQETPLMLASRTEVSADVVKLLLDANSDVNYKDFLGLTALHYAVQNNCSENIKLLVQNRADINAQSLKGATPLHMATKSGNIETMEFLLQNDADPQLQDSKGNTPLIIAVEEAVEDTWADHRAIEILIEASSDLNVRNSSGTSALTLAAQYTSLEILLSLLKAGADPNIADNDSDTALTLVLGHVQVSDCSLECASSLLEHGAAVQFVHPEMIHRLTSLGWSRVVQQLIQRGLPPSEIVFLKNSCGWPTSTPVTPFSVALLMENIELASFMLDVWYLTPSDVRTLSGQTSVTDSLRRKGLFRSVKFLEEVTTRPMTLEQLCFINISSILGTEAHRADNIEKMPLPKVYKNKLKFNTVEISLDDDEYRKNELLHHYILKHGSGEGFDPYEDYSDNDDDDSEESSSDSDFSSVSDF
ncbi:ankyrin-1-like [Physella acuta]|uniref:ankyrin-1-like n=1 Tax=Physella acuta TaxID=109671 RepID=UPI0027DDD3AA|nr:ankyrin-1-like [Physella acuta]